MQRLSPGKKKATSGRPGNFLGAIRGSDSAFVFRCFNSGNGGTSIMPKEQENKAIVGRWFKGFWGNPWDPTIIDELAAPNMLLQYSLHAPRRGREDIKNFMIGFRE